MKKIFKMVLVISLVCICLILVKNETIAAAFQEARAVQSSSTLITNGVTNKLYWRIQSGDPAYTNFCIKGGGRLSSRYYSTFAAENIYDINATTYFKTQQNYNSAMWLVDNAFISSVDENTKALLKENLKEAILPYAGGNRENVINGFNTLSDEQLIAIQACVFWRYSRNADTYHEAASVVSYNNTENAYAQAIFNTLLVAANDHKTYKHTEVTTPEIKTGSEFKINVSSGKTGPFTSNVELTTDNIILVVNNQECTTGFSISKESGKYYITVPTNKLKTGENVTNKIQIKYKGVQTKGYLLTKAGLQNLITINKSLVNLSATGNETTEILEPDLALVKSIISYTDPNSNEVTDTSFRFNPTNDVITTNLENGTSTSAVYRVSKNALEVQKGSTITYRLYVFNEGATDANATIIDYLPSGLELINTDAWTNAGTVKIGNETYTKIILKNSTQNIAGFKNGKISYANRDVKCKVKSTVNKDDILRNYAEIKSFTSSGLSQTDRDSQPNNVSVSSYITTVNSLTGITLEKNTYNQQDDDDFEQVKIIERGFDLALRNYISKINEEEVNREPLLYGKYRIEDADVSTYVYFLRTGLSTFIYEHPKDVLEVSKGDYITYTIKVYNEGYPDDYPGYAYTIIDNLPDGVEYDSEKTVKANENIKWIKRITQTSTGEIRITAKRMGDEGYDEKFNLRDVLSTYASTMIKGETKAYQEAYIVCKVSEDAEVNTNLINTAHIAEYAIEIDTNKQEIVSPTNETGRALLDRDSTISDSTTDTSDKIYAAAQEKLANYSKEFDLYVEGLQDDDDFEPIKVKEIQNKTFNFKIKKVEADESGTARVNSPIGGVEIKYDDDNTVITNTEGIAVLYDEKSIEEDWYTNGPIQCTQITELSSADNIYVPIKGPIYAYYTFKLDGTEAVIDEVKLSNVKYSGINKQQFNSLSTTITTQLKNGNSVNIDIEKAINSNDITITIPNPLIIGYYDLEIVKIDQADNNTIGGVEISVDNQISETDDNGKIDTSAKLTETGWSFKTISEIDTSNSDVDKKYVKLAENINIYSYVSLENYEYKITKIGFGIEAGEYIESGTVGTSLITKEVQLENGKTVTLKLSSTQAANSSYAKQQLIIPNESLKYKLQLQKVDTENNNLSGVTFKINDTTTEPTGEDGITQTQEFEIGKEKVTYTISEVNVGEDYIPLKDSINVYVYYSEENEKVQASLNSRLNKNTMTTTLENGKEVQVTLETTIDSETECSIVKLVIPNEEEPSNYSFVLNKIDAYTGAQLTEPVTFNVQEISSTIEIGADTVIQQSDIISNIDKEIIGTEQLDEKAEIKKGTSYRYRITEEVVPDTYIKTLSEDVIVKIDIDDEGIATAKIERYNGDLWQDGQTEKFVKVYVNEGNQVNLEIVNVAKIEYNFNLRKVNTNGSLIYSDTNNQGAVFNLEFNTDGLQGEKTENIDNLVVNGKYTMNKKDVVAGSTISIKIEEAQPKNGYINLLEGKYIIANYVVNESTRGLETVQQDSRDFAIYDSSTNQKIAYTDAQYLYDTITVKPNNDRVVPEINVKIPNKTITGSYSLQLEKIGENETEKLSDVKFDVNGSIYTTGQDGIAKVCTQKPITVSNVSTKDVYTISEFDAGDNKYITLANSISVYVTKGVVDEKYAATGISFSENETPSTQISTTGTLLNGEVVNIKAVLENETIKVTVPNKRITGSYNLKIKKVNAEEPTEVIENAEFSVLNTIQVSKKVVTDSTGIGIIEQNHTIYSEGSDIYLIKELSVPGGYKSLKYHSIFVRINKGLSDDGLSYIPKNVILTLTQTSTGEGEEEEEELMLNAGLSYSIQNNEIIVTIPNAKTTDYGLVIQKVDADDNTKFLTDATFTVDGPNGNVITEQTLTNGIFTKQEENVDVSKEYKYQIREITPQNTYENILDGMYLELTVVIDSEGKIDQENTQIGIKCEDNSIGIAEIIKKVRLVAEYIKDLTYDAENNTVKLVIENPKMTDDFNIVLDKHELNSSTSVAGAGFRLSQSTDSGATYETIVGDFTTPISSNLDSKQDIVVGTKFYYQLEETTVPLNYVSDFKNIQFTVEVLNNGGIQAQINKIYDGTNWVNYDSSVHGDYINLSVGLENQISISWANSVEYKIKLLKNFYTGTGNPTTSTEEASFRIERIAPTSEVLYEGQLSNSQCECIEDTIKSNSTYKYRITETNTPTGFSNLVENVPIVLTIRTDSHGNIITNTSSTTGSSWKPESTVGLSVATLQSIGKMIGVKIDGNVVNVTFNNYYENYYQVQVVKVDSNGKKKEGAKFAITLPDGTAFDADSETTGVQNPITNSEGTIVLGYRDIGANAVETYDITELVPPSGYNVLSGNITLDVDLTNVITAQDLTQDKLTLTYNEGGNSVELTGLEADVTIVGKTPLITVTIPNEGIDHVFKLTKVDENGDPIQAEEQSNGFYDGAYFTITRNLTGGTNIASGTESMTNLLTNDVLLNGEYQKEAGSYINGSYVYAIQENSTKQGLTNILENYVLQVNVKMDENARIIQPEQGNVNATRYIVTDPHTSADVTSQFADYIELSVTTDENGKDVVEIQILNPLKYQIKLNKKQANGTDLSTAKLVAVEVENGVDGTAYTMQNTSTLLTSAREIGAGETQQWKIYETATQAPYVNILGTNYILLTVQNTDEGIKVLGYKVMNSAGEEVENTDTSYGYITIKMDSKLENVVDIIIENPVKYNFNLVKYDTSNNEIDCADLQINRNGEILTNNGTSRISITESPVDLGDIRVYKIRENDVDSPYVNILEGKELHIGVWMDSTAKLQIPIYEIFDIETGEAIPKTDIAYSYINYEITEQDGVQTVNVKIENPFTYIWTISKQDTAGNPLEGAILNVSKGRGEYSNNGEATKILAEPYMDAGNVMGYKITEESAPAPHVNILENKYILMKVLMSDTGVAEVSSFDIYDVTTNEVLPRSDITYSYVSYSVEQVDGISNVKLLIENPLSFKVNIRKTDTDGVRLEGPNIKIIHSGQEENTNGASYYMITEDIVDIGEVKEYKITETETIEPYVNILDGKYIKLKVHLKDDKTLEIMEFKVYNSSDDSAIATDDNIYNLISARITGTTTQTVRIAIQNPVTFKFEVEKIDGKGASLAGAEIEVDSEIVSDQAAEYAEEIEKTGITSITAEGKIIGTTDTTGKISYTETWVSAGIYEYEIKEIETPGNQYVNPLEGYKIYALVKVEANGNISLVDKNGNDRAKFYIETDQGEEAPEELYEYISVFISNNNTLKASISTSIENRIKYNVNITKTIYGTQNDTVLPGVGIRAISDISGIYNLITNTSGKAGFEENSILPGDYEYFITETSTSGDEFENILSGYYIKVNLRVNANGEINTVDSNGDIKDGQYYIYQLIPGTQKYQLVNFDSTNLDDFISVGISENEDVYTLNVYIKNPQKYNIKINKIDKTTQEKLNNIKFNLEVKDENDATVTLKSATDIGAEIDLSNLVTKKINNIDGVIEINNILIEKAGTYKIILTEEEPEKYQDIGTIELEYTITEDNGKYNVSNMNILNGDYYIKSVATTNGTPQTLITTIQNEGLSGTYNFELLKVDEQGNPLENIIFKYNDGEELATNSEGKISISGELTETGWSRDTITEVDCSNATNGKPYAKIEQIDIYKYTEVVDNKYVVTKVGFSEENGYYKEITDTGAIQTTKLITTEDPGNKAEVKLDASAPIDGVVNLSLEVPNKEVTGSYAIKVLKVDQDGNPIPGVTFKINDETTEPTNEEGILELGTKTITKAGEDKYVISEVNVNGSYLKLKDPVTVTVFKVRAIGRYIAVQSYFDSDHNATSKTVLLEDGKTEVELKTSIKDGIVTIKIPNKKIYFDLALQKFITGVNDKEITNREPVFSNENGEYKYKPEYADLDPVVVANSDIVTYTLRVYNEGDGECYAAEIMDDIPEGLEFASYADGDHSVNDTYKWVMYKEVEQSSDGVADTGLKSVKYDGKQYIETKDETEAKFIRTEYLSKSNESSDNENLLIGFDENTMNEPNSKEVKVQFKVKYETNSIEDTSRIIVNSAQITNDTDKLGRDITDIDSEPNVWTEGEDDQDKEKIRVQYFDLALVKWVSKAIVTENGEETVYEGNKETDVPEPVLKVDLAKSQINNVVVKFQYQIKVTNQGEIAGYVKEISDYIPEGLKFVAEDNKEFKWTESNGKVVTPYLKNTLLQPGESAEVTIILTWINGEDNLGLKINVAEISKDYNDKDDTSDIDSTPDNKIKGEDDIDDAPVMLSVRTGTNGATIMYVVIAIGVLGIIITGVVLIKSFVVKD